MIMQERVATRHWSASAYRRPDVRTRPSAAVVMQIAVLCPERVCSRTA
jgi:hypothetical protein